MNKLSRTLLGLSLAIACAGMAPAQDHSVPKILQITREYTRPGKGGGLHDRTESAFVQAMMRAKWPTHYLAMKSLSGRQRALFLTNYDSFVAWEQDNAAAGKNAALSAALERASVADGEVLDSLDQGVFYFREDLSLRPMPDLSHMRYLEISAYDVRPGHMAEWNELVKMVKDAYEKAVPNAHWGVFQGVYGTAGGTYLVLTARKSLDEIDRSFNEDNPRFMAALGDDGMKRMAELESAAVASSQHELFAFSPNMSYVDEAWKKADDFWKPKATALHAAAPAKAPEKASE